MVSRPVSDALLEDGTPTPGVVGRGVADCVALKEVSQDWPAVTSSNHEENRPSNRLLESCREVSSVVSDADSSAEVSSELVGRASEDSTLGTEATGVAGRGLASSETEGGASDAEGMTITVVSTEVNDDIISVRTSL